MTDAFRKERREKRKVKIGERWNLNFKSNGCYLWLLHVQHFLMEEKWMEETLEDQEFYQQNIEELVDLVIWILRAVCIAAAPSWRFSFFGGKAHLAKTKRMELERLLRRLNISSASYY